MKIRILSFVSVLFFVTTVNSGGQTFELSRKSSMISVTGTSSLHDWEMTLDNFVSDVQFVMDGSTLKSIGKTVFICKPTDIKSDNSLMDKKAYAALKAESFREIKFSMTTVSELVSGNDKFSGNLSGNLTLAGNTRKVSIPFSGTTSDAGGARKIEIKSKVDLAMTDFGISPPTAMMGALKTGDKVTVIFSLQFVENRQMAENQ